MRKTVLSAFLLFLAFNVIAQHIAQTKTADLKKDFKLLPGEVPAGFILRPVDNEARTIGFKTNPGPITDKNFLNELYPNVNIKAVSTLSALMYVKPKGNHELGVYLIEYGSNLQLASEIKKIRAANGSRYFKKENYVFIIWSDAGSFAKEVNLISTKLKQRLALTEFKPAPEDLSSITTTVN